MLLAHAVLLAEARSYLAALADHALTLDGSLEYERVLLELDELHGGVFPPTTRIPVPDPVVLYRVAHQAIVGLADHEADGFGLELCLAMLIAARKTDTRS
ncbi:conserved hypothetical protein [metagenome]|uniref:Uncharacterized protein n=1 Tax=metagenome TaxID=256318 RepID=A0A2P2C8S2_9ZZZZ